ncbi:hypothetical protein [Bradyrhizobium ottawaense]|uniref:Glycosyltransferase RgtA/B/C/D-like domain-containing protein n=1 Tax=Bradyrhizobium ottawaense TaxID=931866 RepID=A0A2U8PCD0_9BRAD|nr:hypothetical protein [Bradyrhizobium ottawaense]AWL95412.1 hypothetical protein CIT37_27150 [Bradyrhizobium ottawaense]MBR1325053.1 hypothetical protein [Bradyrhizobium ottawaense]MBR1333651.1 hypothetical protein [Bradyrhizobium ottawaense]MBR1362572.1 hypothetical protein [Bradyrhizobium ottawaense]
MHSGKRWSWGGWRTSARAGLMTAPFLIAALGLLIKVPPEVQFFSGGPLVAWNSLCLAVLAPYVAIAFVGMGALLVNRLDEGNDLDAADLLVLQFFGGAALCVLIGVCLGAAGLLFPWITIPFLTGIIAWHLARPSRGRWIPSTAAKWLLVGLIGLSAVVLLLVKGVVLDATRGDIPQLYLPLLADLQNRHTLWLDPEQPKLFWFLLGRGHGADMLLVSFGGPTAHQILSVVYLLSIAALVHRMAVRLTTGWILPGCAALIAMWSSFIGLETGRFHYETGAFLLFVCWAGPLYATTKARVIFRALVPTVMSIAIMVPQAAIIATAFLMAGAGAGWFAHGPRGIVRPLGVAAIGLGTAALSLLVNQIYLGIAEVNPIGVFMPLINVERFRQISSLELMVYVNNAQGIKYAGFSMRDIVAAFGRLREVLWSLFFGTNFWTYPAFIVACAAVLRVRRPQGNGPFVVGLALCLLAVISLITLTSHGSLERMLAFRSVATPLIAISIIVPLADLFRRRQLQLRLVSLPSAMVTIALAALVATVVARSQGEITRVRMQGALAFVTGRIGLVGTSPSFDDLDPRRCREVSSHVPADWHILPVNSALRFLPTCAESPLLPSGRVVDTLHPVFLPDYGDVLLGPAPISIAALRRHNVNAFYIESDRLDFWAHGQSPLFDSDSMPRNLDVLHVGADYILLTWKGLGAPISDEQVAAITALRNRSRVTGPGKDYWDGIATLAAWRSRQDSTEK